MGRRQQRMQAGGDDAGAGMKLDGAANIRHREGQAIGHQDDSLRRLIFHFHNLRANRWRHRCTISPLCTSERNANR